MLPDLSKLKCRDQLGEWLNESGLVGSGVEVGSLSGEFARTIISKWNGRTLYLVDPWERQDPKVYREPVNECDWGEAFRSCLRLSRDYPGRILLCQDYSPAAAERFMDGEMDFVYLDGRHDYEAIWADLNAWYPKVRPGGLLAGHDLRLEISDTQHCEVKPAVLKFVAEHGLSLHTTDVPGDQGWWILKPV